MLYVTEIGQSTKKRSSLSISCSYTGFLKAMNFFILISFKDINKHDYENYSFAYQYAFIDKFSTWFTTQANDFGHYQMT